MPLSPSTLDDWTGYDTGPIKSAQKTQNRIRNALNRKPSSLVKDDKVSFSTRLQGSYPNYTITPTGGAVGRSDVDILVQLTSAYHAGLSRLPKSHRQNWRNQRTRPDIDWDEFRRLVLTELRSVYGRGAVVQDDNCIDVETASLPLPADVVVCQTYKRFAEFHSWPGKFDEGIIFHTQDDDRIVNYPRYHKKNGAGKQNNTNDRFKPTVRMFKRARNQLVRDGVIQKKHVPSYFIECLLYRVPDRAYVSDLQDRYRYIVEYLASVDFENMKCQNEITDLFGSGITQWSVSEANLFISELWNLWERS